MEQVLKGTIVWFDLPTRDAQTSIAFYKALFGWKFELAGESHDKKYWNIIGTEGGLGGMHECDDMPHSGAGPLVYFSVDDLDEALRDAEKFGARIVRERTAIPQDGGFYAHIVDPDTNIIGLWSQS